jgi:hypothetical protein
MSQEVVYNNGLGGIRIEKGAYDLQRRSAPTPPKGKARSDSAHNSQHWSMPSLTDYSWLKRFIVKTNDSAPEKSMDAMARAITDPMSLSHPGVAYENVKSEITDAAIPARTPPKMALARLLVED